MERVKPMIESYVGEYLIRGGEIDTFGTNLWKLTRIVLVKFPNNKIAMECYNNVEYKPYKNIKLISDLQGKKRFIIAEKFE